MTVKEAINRSAVLYPAELDREKVYIFLDELEAKINEEVFFSEHVPITAESDERGVSAPWISIIAISLFLSG